uniref:Reverse_transcriptase n=1 Tax=Hildenbrandia rubra TaxID=31481 RepID=A0A1C9CFX3_9FLOR|nr:reverse_transcriptase [Hildenbrandia rubra]AOM67300.1 reverse_transcriptase [Hildenbrandia rubra]
MTQIVLSNMLITNNSLSIVNNQQLIQELISLQKRIYKATIYHDYKSVHKLQKLLLASQSVKLLILSNITNKHFKSHNASSANVNLKSQLVQSFCSTNEYALISKLDVAQLYSFLVDHVFVAHLYDNIISDLVYLSLKPEWEAKFVNSDSIDKVKRNYLYKIDVILHVYLQYNQYSKTKCNKIYVLKNKVDILHYPHNLDYTYLQSKLNTINSINKFIKKYLAFYPNFNAKKDTEIILIFYYISFFSDHLLSLLKEIIMESLSTEVYLCKTLFADIMHKNAYMLKLSRFLWHEGYFIFFSDSKNEAVFIRNRIKNLLDSVGLVFDETNIPIFELRNGFNFLDFHIQGNSLGNISLRASLKSQLVLLKKIKEILYHKDHLNRVRPNTYLSFRSAIRKVNHVVREWKTYYIKIGNTNHMIYTRLNRTIQIILHKWQGKNGKKKKKNAG